VGRGQNKYGSGLSAIIQNHPKFLKSSYVFFIDTLGNEHNSSTEKMYYGEVTKSYVKGDNRL